MILKDHHPDVYAEFLAERFTVKKTVCPFSDIAIDQAHEQNNTAVKPWMLFGTREYVEER